MLVTFHDLEMPTIIKDTGVERTKTATEMTYLENNNIDESIRQNLRNKCVYKTNMHNIYKVIVGQRNKQPQ